MRWSWSVARFAGIDVKIHATFALILVLSVHTPLDVVTARMEETQSRIAAVYDGGGFLGLVSAEDIAEVYMILGAVRQNPSIVPPSAPAAIEGACVAPLV